MLNCVSLKSHTSRGLGSWLSGKSLQLSQCQNLGPKVININFVPRWGSLQRSTNPLAWTMGTYKDRGSVQGRGGEEMVGEGPHVFSLFFSFRLISLFHIILAISINV